MSITPPTVPSINPVTATDEEKLAWVKARAAAEPWTAALSSMIQDMTMLGIPLNRDLMILGMGSAVTAGERGVRDFIDGITPGAVDRQAS